MAPKGSIQEKDDIREEVEEFDDSVLDGLESMND